MALLSPWGGEGGGGRRGGLWDFGIPGGGEEDEDRGREVQDGVDERLSAGGRKRGAAALVAGTRRESQGWGASSGVAGDGDSRGPEDRAADTPRRDSEGGVSPPAPRRSSQTRGWRWLERWG